MNATNAQPVTDSPVTPFLTGDKMSDENENQNLDPITNLAVEVENLKKDINSLRSIAAEKDKQMAQMLNANKRLVAELSASKASPHISAKIDSGQVAYKSFKNTLDIKEK